MVTQSDIFDSTSARYQELKDIEFELFEYTLSVFSKNEVAQIFLQTQDYNDISTYIYGVPGGGGSGGDVNCNCEWDVSCSTLPQEKWCEGDDCRKTARGCSWFWFGKCGHICVKGLIGPPSDL